MLAVTMLTGSCLNLHISGIGSGVKCKGPVTEKTYELSDFNSITVKGSANLFLTQGDGFAVLVKANEEVFEHLNYYVEEGVLVLETVNNVRIKAETFNVYVTLPCLEVLSVNGAADVKTDSEYVSDKDMIVTVNGAGDFELDGGIKVPNLAFTINGAGDVTASKLEVDKLDIVVNGAGDITVSGKAGLANFSVAGAGDIDAHELEYEKITTHKAGAATIRLSK